MLIVSMFDYIYIHLFIRVGMDASYVVLAFAIIILVSGTARKTNAWVK